MLNFLQWGELEEVAHVQDEGALEYGRDNWKKGTPDDYLAAAARHLSARLQGQILDPKSGRPHLAHAIADLLFAFWLDRNRPAKPKAVQFAWGGFDLGSERITLPPPRAGRTVYVQPCKARCAGVMDQLRRAGFVLPRKHRTNCQDHPRPMPACEQRNCLYCNPKP